MSRKTGARHQNRLPLLPLLPLLQKRSWRCSSLLDVSVRLLEQKSSQGALLKWRDGQIWDFIDWFLECFPFQCTLTQTRRHQSCSSITGTVASWWPRAWTRNSTCSLKSEPTRTHTSTAGLLLQCWTSLSGPRACQHADSATLKLCDWSFKGCLVTEARRKKQTN